MDWLHNSLPQFVSRRWAECSLTLIAVTALATTGLYLVPAHSQASFPHSNISALLDQLDGPGKEEALAQLRHLSRKIIPEMVVALRFEGLEPGQVVNALVAIGPDAIGPAEKMTQDSDPSVRMAGIEALSMLSQDYPPPDSFAARLIDLLSDPSPIVQRAALFAIDRLPNGKANALPALIALLHADKAGDALDQIKLKRDAAYVIGRMGPDAQSAAKDLTLLLANSDHLIRRRAEIALQRIGE